MGYQLTGASTALFTGLPIVCSVWECDLFEEVPKKHQCTTLLSILKIVTCTLAIGAICTVISSCILNPDRFSDINSFLKMRQQMRNAAVLISIFQMTLAAAVQLVCNTIKINRLDKMSNDLNDMKNLLAASSNALQDAKSSCSIN